MRSYLFAFSDPSGAGTSATLRIRSLPEEEFLSNCHRTRCVIVFDEVAQVASSYCHLSVRLPAGDCLGNRLRVVDHDTFADFVTTWPGVLAVSAAAEAGCFAIRTDVERARRVVERIRECCFAAFGRDAEAALQDSHAQAVAA